jgi:ABC-type microcin C transport system permease subunit YejB
MLRYLVTRVALLVPTFFLISLVVFVVLNLAPGRPGAANDPVGQSPSTAQETSDRIFASSSRSTNRIPATRVARPRRGPRADPDGLRRERRRAENGRKGAREREALTT